ncbi:hypothetical protein DL93DRAFT_2089589 [Clavulina sp. PMI_390]|nr:hypothetical protein DL93DRAFT_2089589 [Clavulina sp. PMI_390]
MRRLAASLFGRKDDKKQRKESSQHAERPSAKPAAPTLKPRPAYSAASSASSDTSFTVVSPDIKPAPDALLAPGTHRTWKSVFRSRKGSMSSASLARTPSTTLTPTSTVMRSASSGLTRPRHLADGSSGVSDDDDEKLSPPVRPFVRQRSSRSSEPSSSNTNSPRSSSSSLVAPQLPPIPQSPPIVSPSVYMQSVLFRSLTRNPYTSPHPLLTMPTINTTNIIHSNSATLEIAVYPRSVNASINLPPPILSLPQHLARLRLLERLKSHVFTLAEERAILRALSLSRLQAQSSSLSQASPSSPTALRPAAPSLQWTAGQQTPQEVEATQIRRVEQSGISRGLARWVRRGGFEERNVVWTVDEYRGEYISGPIFGRPVAALEFSEGIEAFSGLICEEMDGEPVVGLTPSRGSLPSTSQSHGLLTTSDLTATSSSVSASTRSSSGSNNSSSIGLSTPALSAATSSPTHSAFSLAPASGPTLRSPVDSAPPATLLQRVPSLPKRRGVRFAPSPPTSSHGAESRRSMSRNSLGQQVDRFAKRRSVGSGQDSPLVIVHPSNSANELEITGLPPSPGGRSAISDSPAHYSRQEIDRDRQFVEQRERRRKSSIMEQQRLQEEVIAARKRRESYKVDGGSNNSRAQASLQVTSPFPYSPTHSKSSPSLGSGPKTRRTSTEPGAPRRGGQMWDVTVDDTPRSMTLPMQPVPYYGGSGSTHGGAVSEAGSRRPSIRSVATMHGTGISSSRSALGVGTQSTSGPSQRTARMSLSNAPTNVSGISGSGESGRGLPRRRSLAPGDPSSTFSSPLSPPLPSAGGGASMIPPMATMAPMYGMPYGMPMHMQMQMPPMPMVVVQPVPVPVYMNAEPPGGGPSRPGSSLSNSHKSSKPHPLSKSSFSHSRSFSQQALVPPPMASPATSTFSTPSPQSSAPVFSPSSSSSPASPYPQHQNGQSTSKSQLSLSPSSALPASRSSIQSRNRQSLTPPLPVPNRRNAAPTGPIQ